LVPKDNSTFAKEVEEIINKKKGGEHIFATPFSNLKFKPNFNKNEDNIGGAGHALLLKETNQVEKLAEVRNITSSSPYQITFKVLNQHKEGYGQGKGGRKLTYQESFSKYGSYTHILEIEPLDLGIENLPPITRLEFAFADETNPLASGNYELTKCELYKSKILENSTGKTFTMKVKEFKFYSKENRLYFGTNYDYEFGSLMEKKSQDSPENPAKTPPKNGDINSPSPNHEPQNYSGTLKVVLIVGGIVAGLSFLSFVFYYYKKKKKKG
jgi:hypothetical protein